MKHKKLALTVVSSIAFVGLVAGALAYASGNLLSACLKETGEVRFVIP